MSNPFISWVNLAVEEAMLSPCRSKRGVVIVDADSVLISSGFNHQPFPFQCDGSEACNRSCGKTAIHAEQAAILSAKRDIAGAVMLHVKAIDGKPVASMSPSCLECSKLILKSGIAWMLLLHNPEAQMLPGASKVGEIDGLDIRQYSAQHFHWLTAEYHHRIELILPAPLPTREVRCNADIR